MKSEQAGNQLSPAEQKIQEYVNRIKNGEPKESILRDLPPSFVSGIEAGLTPKQNNNVNESEAVVPPQYRGLDAETVELIWIIPEYVDPEKTKEEKLRKQKAIDYLKRIEEMKINDKTRIEEIKTELGINSADDSKKQQEQSLDSNNKKSIAELINKVSHGRMQAVADLYKKYLDNIDNTESRKNLIYALFNDVYKTYRIAEYPSDPQEELIWENALNNKKVNVNNSKKEWQYRGIFPKKDEETVTRGSLNVHVTKELINGLDELISSGKIKANYKFGQPGTTASPSERHDAISIYFLEQPTNEALQELIKTIKPYVRGDNLLGKKIDDGFFMSEIGSVETRHIEKLVNDLSTIDSALAQAVADYTSSKTGQQKTLKMSEAQYYAIKDVTKVFGCEITYDNNNGFTLNI